MIYALIAIGILNLVSFFGILFLIQKVNNTEANFNVLIRELPPIIKDIKLIVKKCDTFTKDIVTGG